MKHANLGLGPWDVLSDGLAGLTGMQFGTVSIIIGIVLLFLLDSDSGKTRSGDGAQRSTSRCVRECDPGHSPESKRSVPA